MKLLFKLENNLRIIINLELFEVLHPTFGVKCIVHHFSNEKRKVENLNLENVGS